MDLKNKIINFIIKHPSKIVISLILITFLIGTGIYKIKIDTGIKNLIPDDIPSKKIYNKLTSIFGSPEFIMIGIKSAKKDIYNLSTLRKVYLITKELENSEKFDKILSIANLNDIKIDKEGFIITKIINKIPTSINEIDKIKEKINRNSDYKKMFISNDNHSTIIIGLLNPNYNEEKIYEYLKKLTDKYQTPEKIIIGGMPVIRSYIFNHIIYDLLFLIPFVALILIIILFLSLKDINGLRITGMVIGGTILFTFGLMFWLNIPLKIVTSSMPVILISIACADSIHLITKYHYYLKKEKTKIEAVRLMLQKLFLPVILTSLTTIIGFLSLITAILPALRIYGIFISIGVLWALILSLFFLPSMLLLTPSPIIFNKNKKNEKLESLLSNFSDFLLRHKKIFISTFIIILFASLYGILSINIEMNPETFFPKKSIIKKNSDFLNTHFDGTISLSIMIKGDIISPKTLKAMLKIENYLTKQPIVGNARSIADIICKLNEIFQGSKNYYKIPDTKNKISQLLLLYSMSGDSSDFDRFIDTDYKTALINVRIKSSSTKKIKKLVEKFKDYIQKEKYSNIKIYLTGTSVFFTDLVYMLLKSCLISIAISLLFVFIITSISFNSLRLGFYSIIPLSLAVIMDFGLMGWLKIDLNHVTAMLSAIAIGVGIDYAIHYLSSYLQNNKYTKKEERIKNTIKNTGKPILINALSVAAGFSVLLFSSFLPIKFLGGLIAISMISCAIGALTILPLILFFTHRKR